MKVKVIVTVRKKLDSNSPWVDVICTSYQSPRKVNTNVNVNVNVNANANMSVSVHVHVNANVNVNVNAKSEE